MFLSNPINYFELTYYFNNNANKDNYIRIGNKEFYTNTQETFYSFEFKLNKRGGESGTIKFVKPFSAFKIGDTVECKIEGKKIFYGLVEKIEDYGKTIKVIPLWGRLEYIYITDTLVFEETKNIRELVLGLAGKIREAGIKFNSKLIELPEDSNMVKYEITTEMGGKNILEILEELEEELPSVYNFGVDAGGTFFFKAFAENKEDRIDWHTGDFSESEIEEDYSELYSQYLVKHKRYNADGESEDAYDVLKWIVGSSQKDNPYIPIQSLVDKVGVKTKVFEYNFQSDVEEAYKYAYDLLKKQASIFSITISDLNYKKKKVDINQCLEVICKPVENYFVDIELGYSNTSTIGFWSDGGEIMKIGYPIGWAKHENVFLGVLYFTDQPDWTEICNRTLKIKTLECRYYSAQSSNKFYITDGKETEIVYGSGGVLKANVYKFNKRDLKVISENPSVVFYKAFVLFEQGSDRKVLNVRELTYKYSKGKTTVDLTLAELKTVLVGYMHAQNKRLKTLENLLSS